MKKLLAISSSPRAGGNSTILLQELLRGVEGSGDRSVEVDCVDLRGLTIGPCTQCDFCHRTGRCNIEDDMTGLYGKVAGADWLILASPIYYMAHCAQAKLFIDRCQPFWAQRYSLKQDIRPPQAGVRRGVFIAVGATKGAAVFAGAKTTMKWWFDSLQVEYWANLLFDRTDGAGAIRAHLTAVQEAYEMGQEIARLSGSGVWSA